MDKATEKHITSLSNTDLLIYIKFGPERQLPEAITFAQEEFLSRNLSPEQLIEAKIQLRERIAALVAVGAKPLSVLYRIAVFFCGFLFEIPLLLFIPILLRFYEQCEYQKIQDVWFFGLVGSTISTAMVWLGVSPWSQLADFLPIFVLFVILNVAFGLRIFGRTINRRIKKSIGLAVCAASGYLVWVYFGEQIGMMRNGVRNGLLVGLISLSIYCLFQISGSLKGQTGTEYEKSDTDRNQQMK